MTRTHWIATLAALAILALSGAGHGLVTDRWTEPEELGRAVAAIGDSLPGSLGGREGRQVPMDPAVRAQAGIAGSDSRHYPGPDGEAISAILVCGRPGPIATHPPEVCLAGAGFEKVSDVRPVRLQYGSPPTEARFLTADFRKSGPGSPTTLRVYWSWRGGGPWTTPKFPRWAFAARPVLHKLYLIQEVPAGAEAAGAEGPEFLRELLPRLETALLTAPESPDGTTP